MCVVWPDDQDFLASGFTRGVLQGEEPDAMKKLTSAVEIARELIGIDSQNPTSSEEKMAAYVTGLLSQWKIPFQVDEVAPGRPNVIATIRGDEQKPGILLLAHMDTVPVGEGWTKDPFGAEIDSSGRLFGRGSADMKGGLAALLWAIKTLQESGSKPRNDVTLCATVDEEGPDMLGISRLAEQDIVDESSLVVAPEPSELKIVRAHKGVMWYEITTTGRASHGGYGDLGIDANHALACVVGQIKTAVSSLPYDHPLVGRPMVTVGKMAGGSKTNVVPDSARAEVDFRACPPLGVEDCDKLIRLAAESAILQVPGAKVAVRKFGLSRPYVETPQNAPVIVRLASAHKRVVGEDVDMTGYVAYTDAGILNLFGKNKNSIVYGPGKLTLGHTIDEYIHVSEIEKAADVFLDFMSGEN